MTLHWLLSFLPSLVKQGSGILQRKEGVDALGDRRVELHLVQCSVVLTMRH